MKDFYYKHQDFFDFWLDKWTILWVVTLSIPLGFIVFLILAWVGLVDYDPPTAVASVVVTCNTDGFPIVSGVREATPIQ